MEFGVGLAEVVGVEAEDGTETGLADTHGRANNKGTAHILQFQNNETMTLFFSSFLFLFLSSVPEESFICNEDLTSTTTLQTLGI